MDTDALWGEYNSALKAIATGKAGNNTGVERRYGIAYQALVTAGLAQPLRKKYRG